MSDKREAQQRRVDRIEAYVFEGKSKMEIADIEGMPANDVASICNKQRIKGLITGYSGEAYVPIGCRTAEAIKVSGHLARLLRKIDEAQSDGYETARLTGVTKNSISKIINNNKRAYDWSLSQMVRLAEASDMELVELLEWVANEIRKQERMGF